MSFLLGGWICKILLGTVVFVQRGARKPFEGTISGTSRDHISLQVLGKLTFEILDSKLFIISKLQVRLLDFRTCYVNVTFSEVSFLQFSVSFSISPIKNIHLMWALKAAWDHGQRNPCVGTWYLKCDFLPNVAFYRNDERKVKTFYQFVIFVK